MFNLDAQQLLELLEMHTGVDTSAANLSAVLDQIACGWLNKNADAWEKWLPDGRDSLATSSLVENVAHCLRRVPLWLLD